MPFLYINDPTGRPITTIEYDGTTAGTFMITPEWLRSTSHVGTINSTATVNSTATASILWPSDPIMFFPTGSGALFYHAIPSIQTTDYAYPTPYLRAMRVAPTPTRPSAQVKALAKPAIMAGRRALRRSIDLFRMLRPDEEIRTFIGGKSLTVRGHHFDYRIQKRDNLLRHTMNPHGHHIPYDFQMLDKATGQILAKGCTVIPGTPVIDQLLALLLHLEDPDDEVTILWNTNWSPDVTYRLPARHPGERIRMAA